MELVILVFTNREHRHYSVKDAYKLCKDKKVSGTIIDAITPNQELQASLRALIDT